MQRRDALRVGAALGVWGLLVGAGLMSPSEARAAADRTAFSATTLEEALLALGAGRPDASAEIELTVPDIAENGALVPLTLVSRIPDTRQVAILVRDNPNNLAALFTFEQGTLPELQTRVRMAESSEIVILVKAGGRFHVTRKMVRVTIGGCAA